ncbi:MAG: CDP-alcohol phosphatidyltransferase family protein [Candidatus Binatia bacterium]
MPNSGEQQTRPKSSVSDFYAANRGGGPFTEALTQRLAAVIAWWSARAGIKPTVLTLGNLGLGLGASSAVILDARLGWLALLGWQLAYALDCADGQVARVMKQASPAGARIDILSDVALQIGVVTALVVVAGPPPWLAALFAGTWMVNLVTSLLATTDAAAESMVATRSSAVRVIELARDYGAVAFAAGLILTINPEWTKWFIVALTVVNGGFLLVSIAFTARVALRSR